MKHSDLPCWDCDGSTSVMYYEEPKPRVKCYKCNKDSTDKEIIDKVLTGGGNTVPKKKTKKAIQRGIIKDIPHRNISKRTCEKYRVETLFNEDNNPYAIAYPDINEDGEIVAQKVKEINSSRMLWTGIPSLGRSFFGQHTIVPKGKYITITEGEEDCLSVYEMLKNNSPNFEPNVMSLKDGVGSAIRSFKKEWELLNSFENIILCFDGDPIGKQTAKEVANLFPGKTKIVPFPEARVRLLVNEDGSTSKKWELKDANDYLKNNKQSYFIDLWYKAEQHVPKGVRTFNSLWEDMMREDTNTIVPFPWEGLNNMCTGMITGKMDVFKAPPKIGKTSLLSELVVHIPEVSDENVGIIFLENTAKEIGLKFCGIKADIPFDRPGMKHDKQKLKEVHEELSENNRLMIFDPSDSRTVENVFNKIVYFVKAHNCRFIFLDHASMLAYTSENQDERKFLDKLFADLKAFTTTLDIYLGVVIHVNDDGKTRGSRAPIQLCDRLYALERDKLNEDPLIANTTDIIVEENRWGNCGLACKLRYNESTGRMFEIDKDLDVTLTERKVEFADDEMDD